MGEQLLDPALWISGAANKVNSAADSVARMAW